MFHICADDTQVYVPFTPGKETECLAKLEACLEEVRLWMTSNWLKLNNDKTEFIVFGPKEYFDDSPDLSITIGNASVPSLHSVKSIGAYLDSSLKMDKQLSATTKGAWYHLHQIGKIRKYLSEDQTRSIVHALVTCRLDQNNGLLIGLPKKELTKLQRIQNASVRMIVGLKKQDHITPSLQRLHWLPIEERIIFKILLLTYKCLHGKGPTYLQDLLVPYTPARSLRSSSANLLQVPKTRYVDTKKRAFGIRAPQEWNKLPLTIKNAPDVGNFKTALKTFLFRKAYG